MEILIPIGIGIISKIRNVLFVKNRNLKTIPVYQSCYPERVYVSANDWREMVKKHGRFI